MSFLNSIENRSKKHEFPFDHWEYKNALSDGAINEIIKADIPDVSKHNLNYDGTRAIDGGAAEFREGIASGGVSDAEDYRKGIKERTAMTREWSLFLEKYPLILSPYLMQPVGAWDSDTKNVEELRKFLNSGIYSLSISWLSLPAGLVPIGMVDGLPAGVQIIGKRFREDLILNAMQVIEDHTGILTKELWARENIV